MSIRFVEREWNLAGGARIRVRGNGGDHFVDLQLSATVLELKQKLGQLIDSPASGLIITFGDTALEDNMTLEDAHVQETSSLRFEVRTAADRTLTVKLHSGRVIKVVVSESATIRELKSIVYAKESSVKEADMALVAGGEALELDAEVSSIQEGEMVHVISKLEGGF